MTSVATPLIYQLGVGAVLGFLVGYAAKKALKILAVLLGLIAALLIYLGHIGVLSVNYDLLYEYLNDMFQGFGEISKVLVFLSGTLPFAGSFVLGAVIGFKKG